MAPVIVETASGMLTLHFINDLGEVYVCLQDAAGQTIYDQPVDTSVQTQSVFIAPAGNYILTIFDTAGNAFLLENVDIP